MTMPGLQPPDRRWHKRQMSTSPEQPRPLARLREPSGVCLRVEQFPVLPDLEDPAAAGHQRHIQSGRLLDFGRNTLGFRSKISNRAVFDLDRHAGKYA
jgi:hypothetical protein